MSQESRIEVINRDGWRKEYPLQKGIVYIGSAPTSDIVLGGSSGVGVAPLHAQLIASAGGDTPYKLVNLSDREIPMGSGGDQSVSPRAVIDLPDGTILRLGEFTLVFHEGSASFGGVNNGSGSRNIGLRLSLPATRLAPNQTLEGRATIRNLGGKTGARFDIELEGLDEDCFEIEPGPLLSSGAEKDVSFRIYHLGNKPLAGEWTFVIRATSPNAYPGEQAQVYQNLVVLPLYRHRLQLLPAKDIQATSPRPPEPALMTTRKDALRPGGKAEPALEAETQEEWWGPAEETEEALPQREVRRLKAKPVVVTEEVASAPVIAPESGEETPATDAAEEWAVKVETRPVKVTAPTPKPVQAPPVPVVPVTEVNTEEEEEIVEVEAKPLPPEPEEISPPPAPVEPEVAAPEPFYSEAEEAISKAEVEPVQTAEPMTAFSPEPVAPAKESPPPTGWRDRLKQWWPFSGRKSEPVSELAEPDRAYSEWERVQPPVVEADQTEVFVPEPELPPPAWVAKEESEVETVSEEPILEELFGEADRPAPMELAEEVISTEEPTPALEIEEIEPEESTPPATKPEKDWWFEEETPEVEAEEVEEEELEDLGTEPGEDWWLEEKTVSPPLAIEAGAVSPAPVEEKPPAEDQAAEEPEQDDWWAEVPPPSRAKTEEQQIIRLKAAPPPQVQPKPPAEEETAEVEAWWETDVEVSSSEQSNKKS